MWINRACAPRFLVAICLPCFGAFLNGAVEAADGRIPIFQPITITQSGSYVLTRDLSPSTGPAITVADNLTVDIDLAGHVITSGGVRLERASGLCGALRLRNGRVAGAGVIMIYHSRNCVADVLIERMTFDSADIDLSDERLSVLDSHFSNASIIVYANGGPSVARIAGNLIEGGSIVVNGYLGAQIRENTIRGGSIAAYAFSGGWDLGQYEIDGNTADSIHVGGGTSGSGSGVTVTDNVVSAGIDVVRIDGVRIANNLVKGGVSFVASSNAIIEGNRIWGGSFGIAFDGSSTSNTFRNNVLRSNASGPVLDNGTANVDAGGNIQ